MITESPVAKAFRDEWMHFHKDRHPIGWFLRTDELLPWIRFHALPGSKRYAEDDVERAIIVSRAKDLGNLVLGAGASCWLVRASRGRLSPAGDFVGQVIEEEEEDWPWQIHVQPVRWTVGDIDTLLTEIAEDRVGPCLWMARDTGAIFAPYDGGFDLFPASLEQVAALRTEKADWLSSHPSGL